MIKRLTTIAAASSLAITPIFAQSSPVSIEDTVTVTATVSPADLDAVPAKLVVSTLYSNVTFNDNDGTPLSVGGGVGATLSRYVSDVVTLDYVAPYGPWDIRIYTTRSDELEGLVDSSKDDPAGATAAAIAATDTIPLKFTTAPLTGANAFDISDDADWAGEDAVFSFVIKKDTDTSDGLFFFKLASSASGDAPANPNFEFRFGVDVLGAAAISYSADVTIELYIQ